MSQPLPPSGLLPFEIQRQPDDSTCGPTCLHAVYRYLGEDVPLAGLIDSVPALDDGGTLGVLLATDAIERGYEVKLVTWNLMVFDPTWFQGKATDLRDKLLRRADAKAHDPKLRLATLAYARFVGLGGRIEFRDLDAQLLRRTLRRGIPMLTGLSATFLYRESRQLPTGDVDDDIAGDAAGHFVVLTGYDRATRSILVTDPLHPNPLSTTHTYPVPIERVIGAIYLGVLTYDGNLTMIEPRSRQGKR